jgi:ABC-type transporter MlaC component
MSTRFLSAVMVLASMIALTKPAFADEAEFVRAEHETLTELLRAPASSDRDQAIDDTLAGFFDHDEIARRSFREHWSELSPRQRTAVQAQLSRLVQKSHRRNLVKTRDYDVIIQNASNHEVKRVTVRATSRTDRRVSEVTYELTRDRGDSYRVVDLQTEGASMTTNHYRQFHEMLTDPSKGFEYLLRKVTEAADQQDDEADRH